VAAGITPGGFPGCDGVETAIEIKTEAHRIERPQKNTEPESKTKIKEERERGIEGERRQK